MSKPKRRLKKVRFDFTGAHLAMTDMSAGGAASGLNDAYLFKAQDDEVKLSDEQKDILSLIGEEFVPLDKTLEQVSTPESSLSEDGDGEDNKVNKGTDNTMSDNTVSKEEFEALKKELAIQKAANSIAKYNFENASEVASAVAGLDSEAQAVVFKAFDSLVEAGESAKAEALEKAKDAGVDTNKELKDMLDEEHGVEGGSESAAEPETKMDELRKARKEAVAAAGGAK